jgi:hypothetical protein
MKACISLAAAVTAAALLAPRADGAEGVKGRFALAVQGGTQSELAGDFLIGAEGGLIGKPVTIESKRYRDLYEPDLRLQVLIGFGIGERTEVVSRATHYEAEATGIQAGAFAGNPLFAFFGPYKEWGVELGLRYYLASQTRLKSYVAPMVGVRTYEEVLVSFVVPDAGSAVYNVPFHESGTVPVFGLDIGFSFDLTDHVFVGIDTGLRYQPKPTGFNELPELGTIDDGDARWTAPVVAALGVRF